MGCACVKGGVVTASASARVQLASDVPLLHAKVFLPSVTATEFLASLDVDERKDKKRLLEWFHKLDDGEFEAACTADRDHFATTILEQGVPERFRWLAWRALCGWREHFKVGHWRFVSEFGLAEAKLSEKALSSIAKDLDRTFPSRPFFSAECGAEGRRRLEQLLRAYCMEVPRVGYCQGMNFVAGFLVELSHDHGRRHSTELARVDPEEDSFWVFLQLMERYKMWLFFDGNLPMLSLFLFQFEVLFQSCFPDLAAHLDEQEIFKESYGMKWFATLFTLSFPFNTVKRMWDMILCNGTERSVVPLALAVLKLLKDKLLKLESSDIQSVFRGLGDFTGSVSLNSEDIIRAARGLLAEKEAELTEAKKAWQLENPTRAAELQSLEEKGCHRDASAPSSLKKLPPAPEADTGAVAEEKAGKSEAGTAPTTPAAPAESVQSPPASRAEAVPPAPKAPVDAEPTPTNRPVGQVDSDAPSPPVVAGDHLNLDVEELPDWRRSLHSPSEQSKPSESPVKDDGGAPCSLLDQPRKLAKRAAKQELEARAATAADRESESPPPLSALTSEEASDDICQDAPSRPHARASNVQSAQSVPPFGVDRTPSCTRIRRSSGRSSSPCWNPRHTPRRDSRPLLGPKRRVFHEEDDQVAQETHHMPGSNLGVTPSGRPASRSTNCRRPGPSSARSSRTASCDAGLRRGESGPRSFGPPPRQDTEGEEAMATWGAAMQTAGKLQCAIGSNDGVWDSSQHLMV
mmetsp:Transcript_97027/g.222323  ORF Transcript_97027/g.222323 Transcript_97027/m.222323 type:complete len:745 (-) Transcript_97027:159-2393(-)